MKEAIEYISISKLDTVFTTRTSTSIYRRYNCRENVLDRVNSPKRKVYKAHSSASVKTVKCMAGFKVQKRIICNCSMDSQTQDNCLCDSAKEEYVIRGCLSHSHEEQCRNKRLSPLTKAFILKKLKDGVPIEKILELHFTKNVSIDSDEKIVTYSDIMYIARQHGIGGIDITVSERQNCLDLLECPGFIGFNWENTLGPSPLPPNLMNKLIETNGKFSLIYMDENMRRKFRNNPYVLSLDSTHHTNRAGFLLVSILVYGKYVE